MAHVYLQFADPRALKHIGPFIYATVRPGCVMVVAAIFGDNIVAMNNLKLLGGSMLDLK